MLSGFEPWSAKQLRDRPSLSRSDAVQLGRPLLFHSTTVGRCSNEPLRLEMQIDAKKTQLGVSACMPACLIDCLPACLTG